MRIRITEVFSPQLSERVGFFSYLLHLTVILFNVREESEENEINEFLEEFLGCIMSAVDPAEPDRYRYLVQEKILVT